MSDDSPEDDDVPPEEYITDPLIGDEDEEVDDDG